jgi:hypothetical protein
MMDSFAYIHSSSWRQRIVSETARNLFLNRFYATRHKKTVGIQILLKMMPYIDSEWRRLYNTWIGTIQVERDWSRVTIRWDRRSSHGLRQTRSQSATQQPTTGFLVLKTDVRVLPYWSRAEPFIYMALKYSSNETTSVRRSLDFTQLLRSVECIKQLATLMFFTVHSPLSYLSDNFIRVAGLSASSFVFDQLPCC